MLFNTLDFAFFFAGVLALYHALPRRGQNLFLLLASYAFYAAWDWRFCGLLLTSTAVDFFVGSRLPAASPQGKRRLLGLSLGVNLGLLGFFKYFDFFADSLRETLGLLGVNLPDYALRIALPVGISFYTFQTLSYTVDVYRGSLQPTRRFLDFALFVSFFPQLVAGPIERARRLLPQILGARRVRWNDVQEGAWLILWGVFKKVYVSDNVAHLVDTVYTPGVDPTGIEVLLALYGFAFQVYCDFSGYSDIARGTARLLGFDLMLNFDLPYLATNPQEVWRRWHISLSTWLRDYVYIPLGGSRGSSRRNAFSLFATMLIAGLWHGAAWTYVVFGAYHGLLLVAHRALKPWLGRIAPTTAPGRGTWWFARWVAFFHLWCLGLLLFRAQSFGQAAELGRALFTDPRAGLAVEWVRPFALFVGPLVAVQLWQAVSRRLDVVLRSPFLVRTAVYALLFTGIVLLGEDHGEPFIYFQF